MHARGHRAVVARAAGCLHPISRHRAYGGRPARPSTLSSLAPRGLFSSGCMRLINLTYVNRRKKRRALCAHRTHAFSAGWLWLAESDAFSVPLHTSCAAVCCVCVCECVHAPSCCHPVCREKRAIAHPRKCTYTERERYCRGAHISCRRLARTLNCICGAQWRSARFATVLFAHQMQSARRAKWADAHVRAGVDKKWIAELCDAGKFFERMSLFIK